MIGLKTSFRKRKVRSALIDSGREKKDKNTSKLSFIPVINLTINFVNKAGETLVKYLHPWNKVEKHNKVNNKQNLPKVKANSQNVNPTQPSPPSTTSPVSISKRVSKHYYWL